MTDLLVKYLTVFLIWIYELKLRCHFFVTICLSSVTFLIQLSHISFKRSFAELLSSYDPRLVTPIIITLGKINKDKPKMWKREVETKCVCYIEPKSLENRISLVDRL